MKMDSSKRFCLYNKNEDFLMSDNEILNIVENKIYSKNNSFLYSHFIKKENKEENISDNRDTIYSTFEEFDIDKFLFNLSKKIDLI